MKTQSGARAKLRKHFLKNIGKIMDSSELQEVAGGITEWARRIRELRNEEGYQIHEKHWKLWIQIHHEN